MVLIVPDNKVRDESVMKTIMKYGNKTVEQKCHNKQTSNLFYMNMKQQGSRITDMKPLRHYTDAPLYEAFWPFLMGMKLVGLFHNKQYADTLKYGCQFEKEECPSLEKRITPSSIYSFVVMLLLWINAARYLSAFEAGEGFGPILFQKLITLSFFTLIAITATACYLASHKYSNIPEFFYEWARLHQDYPGKNGNMHYHSNICG